MSLDINCRFDLVNELMFLAGRDHLGGEGKFDRRQFLQIGEGDRFGKLAIWTASCYNHVPHFFVAFKDQSKERLLLDFPLTTAVYHLDRSSQAAAMENISDSRRDNFLKLLVGCFRDFKWLLEVWKQVVLTN
jgi:hypothetical protein